MYTNLRTNLKNDLFFPIKQVSCLKNETFEITLIQEAEVDRLSKEVSAMQNVSIQTNVVTVSTGSDSGIESGEEDVGPPPAPGTQSEEDVTQKHVSKLLLWNALIVTRY